jgi:energy-coupling factor transport system ATP-binding protein
MVIECREVTYGIVHISQLFLPSGLIAVTGDNGSGKTTFLKLISGLLRPKTGIIEIDKKSPEKVHCGWVGDNPDKNLLFETVLAEISSPLWFAHCPPDVIDETVKRVAKEIGIEHLLLRSTRKISGGEKVLVALATALVSSPTLLIMDESDAYLDEKTARRVYTAIRARNIAHVVYTTHRDERMLFAHMSIQFKQGTII